MRQICLPQEVRGRTDISLSTFPLKNQAAFDEEEMARSCGQRAGGTGSACWSWSWEPRGWSVALAQLARDCRSRQLWFLLRERGP